MGIPSLRIKGFYLMVATLAFQFIIEYTIIHWESLTRGIRGIELPAPHLFGLSLGKHYAYFYFLFLLAAFFMWGLKNLNRCKIGRAFIAIRDRDVAAGVMGVSLFRYKLLAFVISSFYAGVAGGLMAHHSRIIFPDACTLLDYMLVTLTKLMEGLIVYPENMARNLELSLGLWNSQTVLLALVRKGLTREAAYELVQRNAMKTWAAKHAGRADANFLQQLRADPEVSRHFRPGELEKLCSLDFHFKQVAARFRKLGL